MRTQRGVVKRRLADARAKADFLDEWDGAESVEKVQDAWLDARTDGANRQTFVDFVGEHRNSLNEVAIADLIDWTDWQPAEVA